MANPPITVGELTDVPAPESPVNAQFHQEVAHRIIHRFASVGAMNGWNAGNGSIAFVPNTYYLRIGGAWQALATQAALDAEASARVAGDSTSASATSAVDAKLTNHKNPAHNVSNLDVHFSQVINGSTYERSIKGRWTVRHGMCDLWLHASSGWNGPTWPPSGLPTRGPIFMAWTGGPSMAMNETTGAHGYVGTLTTAAHGGGIQPMLVTCNGDRQGVLRYPNGWDASSQPTGFAMVLMTSSFFAYGGLRFPTNTADSPNP